MRLLLWFSSSLSKGNQGLTTLDYFWVIILMVFITAYLWQLYAYFRFRKGIQVCDERIEIPTFSGRIRLNKSSILGYGIKQTTFGRAFDYIHFKIDLKDSSQIKVLLPLSLIKEAKLLVAAE